MPNPRADGRQGGRGREQTPLPPQVVNALNEALLDERKAYETYQAILDRFEGARPFVNIVAAEARHIGALLAIYERYGVKVPPDDALPAEAALTAPVNELCRIGVMAEIENVRLYDEELLPAVEAYPDIFRVMKRLRDASCNNHLPAFQRCVARKGTPGGCNGHREAHR